MHSTRHFLKKKSFLNASKVSLKDSNDLKVFSILSQVRFESSPPDRNPTQMLLDILATADLNVNKNKKEPQPPPTVSEKQNQADFFGMVLSNKKSQETDGGDENLQDLDSVEGEDYADRDNYDIYDDEDFDFSDLEESVRPPTTPTPKLAPEADINSRVAVIQDPLTEDEERDLAQLVGSVSFEIFDEDKKPMKSIDQVFKLLFNSIESNTKQDTCLSGFLPSDHFYLRDIDYGNIVDNDGIEVFCLALQVTHSYLYKLTTTEFNEYVLYLNRFFQQKFNLRAANLTIKITSHLGELEKQSPFEYFNKGKIPAADLKRDFEQKLDMPFLNEADREKVERWFAVERFKIRARNDIAEHFSGERNNSESTDKYVVVKEVDEATEKARQEKYSSFVESAKAGEKPSQEAATAHLLKSSYVNRKVNYRGAKEEPSWLRDNDDFEVTETALEETELGANTGDEEEGEVIEHSDLASLPIIEDESINYDSERGSAVKASFREDGSVEERKQPRPPKGSIEVARGQHQFFCREDFLLRFEIHQPAVEYDDQSFLNLRGKNEEEEIDFFVKRDRFSQAETRF